MCFDGNWMPQCLAHSKLLKSPALSPNPMCALSGPTTGSCKALPHIGETVFTTSELEQFSGESFTEGLSPPLIASRASHVYVKICIFNSYTFHQRPPYWRALAKGLTLLWLSTFSLLALPLLCALDPPFYKEVRVLFGLLSNEVISQSSLYPSDPYPVPFHGGL